MTCPPSVRFVTPGVGPVCPPSAFSNSWCSLSSNFHLFVKICFFVMSSRSCFLWVNSVSTALLHEEDRSRTTVCMISRESISSSHRSMIVKLAPVERFSLCSGLSRSFWRVTIWVLDSHCTSFRCAWSFTLVLYVVRTGWSCRSVVIRVFRSSTTPSILVVSPFWWSARICSASGV